MFVLYLFYGNNIYVSSETALRRQHQKQAVSTQKRHFQQMLRRMFCQHDPHQCSARRMSAVTLKALSAARSQTLQKQGGPLRTCDNRVVDGDSIHGCVRGAGDFVVAKVE